MDKYLRKKSTYSFECLGRKLFKVGNKVVNSAWQHVGKISIIEEVAFVIFAFRARPSILGQFKYLKQAKHKECDEAGRKEGLNELRP